MRSADANANRLTEDRRYIDVSVVIPVYHGAESIGHVVERVHQTFADVVHEIILVDDGSSDDSPKVCRDIVARRDGLVTFVALSKNFGEHSAVLAGLSRTSGRVVAVLDDDGQNPPEELPRMIDMLRRENLDVVYGRYSERKHAGWRRLGSWFNDRVACVMLGKPRDLYLSSFKVMSRFIVDQVLTYPGPFPYIDGLICRATTRLGQIPVEHAARVAGQSNYTLVKLFRLWTNMFVGFSILPLRLASLFGLAISSLSVFWLLLILIDKIFWSPNITAGIPTVLAAIVLFSGVQLIVLGTIGEYLGRLFLTTSGQPQFVVREEVRSKSDTDSRITDSSNKNGAMHHGLTMSAADDRLAPGTCVVATDCRTVAAEYSSSAKGTPDGLPATNCLADASLEQASEARTV